MTRSMKKKIENMQEGKKDNGKRNKNNRGRHGCYRLHKMRHSESVKVEADNVVVGKSSMMDKLKGMFKR